MSTSTARQRTLPVNGVELRLSEQGDGPPVILAHGFPELAYSWRFQLPALAAAGFRAVAPDQRGYGGSTRPDAVADYDILHLTDDLVGVLDDLGEERAVFVGHDWGAMLVWQLSLLHPERVAGVAGMSVPFLPRGPIPPVQLMRRAFADRFFYIVYFQEPGVADADLGRDPATTMRRMLAGLSAGPGDGALAGLAAPNGVGFVDRLPEPEALPPWLTEDALDHYVSEFTRTGFTGGINWYRNFDRNWELTPQLDGAKVTVPSLFIGGALDPVLVMSPPTVMDGWVTDHHRTLVVEGAGHWVQQEKPDEVNEALVAFVRAVHDRDR